MRQKLSMILAFIIEPKALLVDEPMVGLDPASIEEVLELFRQLRAEGTAILISTHIIDIVNDIWDRAYIMNRGEIVKEIDRKDAGEETLKEIFLKLQGRAMYEFILLFVSDKNKRFCKSSVFFFRNRYGSHFYGFNLWNTDRNDFYIFCTL